MQKTGVLCGFIVFLQQEGALGLKGDLIMVVWHVSITTSNPICLTLSNGHNKIMPFFTSLPVLTDCFYYVTHWRALKLLYMMIDWLYGDFKSM